MARIVLTVEDNDIERLMLKTILADEYETVEAENGVQALSAIKNLGNMLSAVLLDIHMPGMDGYEVLRLIRENPEHATLPVIVVTASEDKTAIIKALSLGADDYISKPYHPDILKHFLKKNIAMHEAMETIAAMRKNQ